MFGKIQDLMGQWKTMQKLLTYPKLMTLMQNPEIAQLLAKVDFRTLLQA